MPKDMFSSLEDAKSLIQEEMSEPCGSLKVATTVALASLWLVEIVPDFLDHLSPCRKWLVKRQS